ncbi:hypothetical protein INT45_005584 [Circinella minor]|uniref:Uncharacterized protein n=1 Tax=Circinella minor TaxID=1195481 RepID=A0A8H7S9H2_9FUNG|nr:hypothetical protein INT45_005584 [Circinella minor]
MRLQNLDDNNEHSERQRQFARELLQIGDGQMASVIPRTLSTNRTINKESTISLSTDIDSSAMESSLYEVTMLTDPNSIIPRQMFTDSSISSSNNNLLECMLAKDLEANLSQQKPNWRPVEKALAERAVAPATNTPLVPTPSSSLQPTSDTTSDSERVKKDKKRTAAVYDRMVESKMWGLKSGKYVEKEMKVVALEQEYEHPAHSVILDPTDPVWENRFNTEELKELRTFNRPIIPELPPHLEQFVESFEEKDTLDELYYHVRSFRFHPLNESVLHWMQIAVEEALMLLYHGYFTKNRTEADIIRRAWGFMDSCFDSSKDIISNSGEKASRAASEAQNQNRSVGGVSNTTRKKVGTKVDQLFAAPLFEPGAMEAGAESDRSSSKSITELHLKCPKTLKDMAVEMERFNPAQLHHIKSCGFIISGLYLQFLVLDCPAGYTCRVTKLPDWLPYPMSSYTLGIKTSNGRNKKDN